MPPEDRMICRFPAEPPQEGVPTGRWADTLQAEFLAACLRLSEEPDEDGEKVELGDVGPLVYHPDRTWAGRTYVPATTTSSTGFELYGYVSFAPADEESEPSDFAAWADFTDETADKHPEWKLDIAEEVIGGWRGEGSRVAAMTLVWGVPIVRGGHVATGELAGLVVDQCTLLEGRFTLLAPDDYRGDLLEIKLFSARGEELARESLYDGDEIDADSVPDDGAQTDGAEANARAEADERAEAGD
jgi:hypothetical protein